MSKYIMPKVGEMVTIPGTGSMRLSLDKITERDGTTFYHFGDDWMVISEEKLMGFWDSMAGFYGNNWCGQTWALRSGSL